MTPTIVLARPKEPRNIGACCRAAKNFGCTHVVVVGNPDFDQNAARGPAIGADDVLDGITHVASLPDILQDLQLAVGYTRRLGQKRKMRSFDPWELAEKLYGMSTGQDGRSDRRSSADEVALVFGNETSGLSDEELGFCHMAVSLPTDQSCPSMNLSHAVAVALYELRTRLLRPAGGRLVIDDLHVPTTEAPMVPSADIDVAVDMIAGNLQMLGFHVQDGPQGMPRLLRDILARATITPDELERFAAMFAKLAGMHSRRE